MKVSELIELLEQVDGENYVTIDRMNFTGLSIDDNNDVELYVVSGDILY